MMVFIGGQISYNILNYKPMEDFISFNQTKKKTIVAAEHRVMEEKANRSRDLILDIHSKLAPGHP